MQWYVYLITILAAAFAGQVLLELIVRPIATALRLRRKALARLRVFRDIELPRPRETAVSSQQIREYDWAARNVRTAQQIFGDLGIQLIAFGETEPTIRALLVLCGLDIDRAGRGLIKLSLLYAMVKGDSERLRRPLERAHLATMAALAALRRPSGDSLIKIKLEPMRLGNGPGRRQTFAWPRRVVQRRSTSTRFGAGPARRFAS